MKESTPSWKGGEIPLQYSSKHQIDDSAVERADAERDGRTSLARPNPQARTGTGNDPVSFYSLPKAGLATIPG